MCGFSGVLLSSSTANSKLSDELCSVVSNMTSTIVHRGPDSEGFFCDGRIAMGHRRLSILDVSDAGAQPMELYPGGPVVAYNGECYNFTDLKYELETLGRTFRSHSDTEVILHVYDVWGMNGLKRLEGIFAFALWDPSLQRLLLMRDRLGVKPLYYGESEYGFAFGSEINTVLAAGGVDTTLDDQSFSEYLWYGNSYEDRTFYSGIRAVQPGHWLKVEGKMQRVDAWWSVEEWLDAPSLSECLNVATNELTSTIDTAVRRQLVADVPVGIFLSGGIDSSAIAASAMHVQSQPLASYSSGFDFDRGVNELPKARAVASHLGLSHHELQVSGAELEGVLQTLAKVHGEPFADAANIPLYLMCRELNGQIKVVLQGDGGDELFAGYRRYALLRNSRWWRMFPVPLSRALRFFGGGGRRLARLVESVGNVDAAMRMALLLTMETKHEPPEILLEPERREFLVSKTDPFLAYRNAGQRFSQYDPVQQMLLTDLVVQLPSQFLTKVDRATMAAGIEARVPLLDESIVKLAVRIPSTWKVRGTEKKMVLRESQRGRLPDEILDGPKTGFGVPYQHWLRTSLFEYAKEHLLDHSFLETFSFNQKVVEQALEMHHNGQRERGFTLWKLLQLAIWHEQK